MAMQMMAWVAAALVFACFFMKTIVPLRMLAIASNLAFIGYAALGFYEGIFSKVLPIFVLHLALLPLNVIRVAEVRRVISSISTFKQADLTYEFLIPFMTSVHSQAGTNLFVKGEGAKDVYIVKSGSIHLTELGKALGPGSLFGEVAVFSHDATRNATAHCQTDCELFRIAGDRVRELFYQDRRFSFKIARLLAGYAQENLDHADSSTTSTVDVTMRPNR